MKTYALWYMLFGHLVLLAGLYWWVGDYSPSSAIFVGLNGILGLIGLIYTICEHIYKELSS